MNEEDIKAIKAVKAMEYLERVWESGDDKEIRKVLEMPDIRTHLSETYKNLNDMSETLGKLLLRIRELPVFSKDFDTTEHEEDIIYQLEAATKYKKLIDNFLKYPSLIKG